MLAGKTVLIFGGSGAIGAATARVCLREGAAVWLAARGEARLTETAERLAGIGAGPSGVIVVDALDATAIRHAVDTLAARIGAIHGVINATSFLHDQGSVLEELDVDRFMTPVDAFLRSLFNTSRAAAPHMGGARPGVMLTLSTPAGRTATPGHLGYSVACAGVEAFTRVLAAELGPRNIRAVCLAPHAISDAPAAGSYTAELFRPKAQAMGLDVDQWLQGGAQSTLLGRLPTLSDVAETAAFLLSDRAGAMTAAYVNLTAGMIPE